MKRTARAVGVAVVSVALAGWMAVGCGSEEGQEPSGGSTSSGTGGQGGQGDQGGGGEGGGATGTGGQGPGCTPGATILCYSGPPETVNVGICRWGESTCHADGSGYGACEGEVLPREEVLGDAVDDDCDGTTVAVGESLVARYYFNEDPAAGVTQVEDTSSQPLPLQISNPNPSMPVLSVAADAEGHRGLTWTTAGSTATASAPFVGTKVQTRLNGNQAFTIELVARIEGIVNFSRLVFLGRSESSQNPFDALVLRFDNAGRLQAYIEDTTVGRWAYDYVSAGRSVLQLVVDSTQPIPDQRRKLYVNGVLLPAFDTNAPAQFSNVNLGTSTVFSVGSRPGGSHSIRGTIYYLALYETALAEAELQANATQLMADDDTVP
ncbi:LamG-like jellyroll fold domain-containing protein [Chondromyces apiculatus]|nr:LamG-like jellyroll fold domain-containing protein [Chondromyces apiculatus]